MYVAKLKYDCDGIGKEASLGPIYTVLAHGEVLRKPHSASLL